MAKIEQAAVDIECEPGDVVLFSNILVHCGGQNSTKKIRWSLDWRFQDASKPTLRAENGHIIYSRDDQSSVVKDDETWSSFCISQLI
jgi:ectoine hydroxylase-related dioxygenase (phytanoyl-CoA dioxygenase family)